MSNWQMAFRVGETQDRDTRYTEVRNVPNINSSIISAGAEGDVEAARDTAFAHIDDLTISKPYEVYLSGDRTPGLAFQLHVAVAPSP